MTASSQDSGSLRKSHCELYTLMLDYLYCTADCPVSYLMSASDVLSNVSVLHDPMITESLVQDVTSFDTIYCDLSFAASDIFTLKFSEKVLVDRISRLQLSAFTDKIVSKNSKICLFFTVLVNTSDNCYPEQDSPFSTIPHNCYRKQSQSAILLAHQCVWLSLNTFQ